MKKKLVVNFFGAPGAGKSTAAAYIYAALKFAGIKCEMCLEHAKFFVYEKNRNAMNDQNYIFANQCYELATLYNSCDVVITDSPLLTFTLYNNLKKGKEAYNELIYSKFSSFNNVNYYLHRHVHYCTFGRYQTEEEADDIGKATRQMLRKYNVQVVDATSKREELDEILKQILEILQNEEKN